MRAHLLRLPTCIVAVSLLAALGSASAQGTGKKGANNAGYAQVVHELHQTRVLLQEANHDYDGFRAKAVHEIGKAMHALHPAHKHKAPKAAVPTGGGEDQKVSDMQLAQANKQLQVVIGQLTSAAATPQTTTAVQYLQSAVGHLNTALKIR
jgi:hypothetical protein